jgi:hypothetical protein
VRGYQFVIRVNGASFEDLGIMALAHDGEAFTFGNLVIRDLMDGDAAPCIGWIMDAARNG